MFEMWWEYLLGYIFSVGGSRFFIKPVVKTMVEKLGQRNPFSWTSEAVGYIEGVLYTSSWLLGKSEFIAVWLALKVAGQWGRWTDGSTNSEKVIIPGRAYYNIFLTGSGLSISYAVVGALIVEWLIGHKLIENILVPISLLIGTLLLWIWVKYYVKSWFLK